MLKPINKTDLQRALDKLVLLRKTSGGNMEFDYRRIVQELRQEKTYKTHFLIPVKGNRLFPVSVDTILYFYIADGTVKAVDKERMEMVFPQTLDELTEVLNPQTFFRANWQFLISKQAMQDVVLSADIFPCELAVPDFETGDAGCGVVVQRSAGSESGGFFRRKGHYQQSPCS